MGNSQQSSARIEGDLADKLPWYTPSEEREFDRHLVGVLERSLDNCVLATPDNGSTAVRFRALFDTFYGFLEDNEPTLVGESRVPRVEDVFDRDTEIMAKFLAEMLKDCVRMAHEAVSIQNGGSSDNNKKLKSKIIKYTKEARTLPEHYGHMFDALMHAIRQCDHELQGTSQAVLEHRFTVLRGWKHAYSAYSRVSIPAALRRVQKQAKELDREFSHVDKAEEAARKTPPSSRFTQTNPILTISRFVLPR
eukprot:GABV01008959.1.p1 GENE.GABV01008959.1~~GABV01008959.1.p1  ORF type:complete len:282 (+),score=70.35 GABV01008959.1:99-848(+)